MKKAQDELGKSLEKARRDIADNNLKSAAANVRQGLSFLKDEIRETEGTDQKQLQAAVALLEQVSSELDSGKLDKARIDKAFAASHRADVEERWVAVTSEEWIPYIDQPDTHLNQARAHLLKKNFGEAAMEIRKASAYMELEKSRAVDEANGLLDEPIKEPKDLADAVEKGTVDDVAKLDDAFARADHALARHHYLAAANAWKSREQAAAGYSMWAAARYLERAVERTEEAANDATGAVITKTRSVAEGLIDGAGDVAEETGKQIEKMGKAIQELGKKVGTAS
jgi:HAMP domain-containing protein